LAEGVSGSADYAKTILKRITGQEHPCIFCSILAGESPGSFVYRDELVSVIMDLYPITHGHLLIIPNTHAASMHEVEPEVAARMMHVAQRIARGMSDDSFGCDGYNLFLANGGAGHQDVFHVHLHVIPRYHGDGFGFILPEGYPQEAERDELNRLASQITGLLSDAP
jgi:histidine triad (HIT) family protein